jgi:hypothetical protein
MVTTVTVDFVPLGGQKLIARIELHIDFDQTRSSSSLEFSECVNTFISQVIVTREIDHHGGGWLVVIGRALG